MVVSTDSLRLAVVEEVTQGVTPPVPVFDLVRTTGEGLTYELTTQLSEELSGGEVRGVADDILTGAMVTGEVSFEMSKSAAFELLLEGMLGADWGDDPLGITVTTDEAYDGTKRKSYTFEKRFTLTDTPTYSYHQFLGCVVDTMTLSIAPGSPITGAFGFTGNLMDTAQAPLGADGDAYVSAGSNPVFTSDLVTGITFLDRDTDQPVAWMADTCVTECTLNVADNARGIECIGLLGYKEVIQGRIEITADVTIIYSGDGPVDAMIDRTEYKMQIVMTDSLANSYEVLLDRVKLASAPVNADATNSDVMVPMAVTALKGAPDPLTIKLTRGPGPAQATGATQRSGSEIGSKPKEKVAA